MGASLVIAHDIPGRLRVVTRALEERKDHFSIESLFISIRGVLKVRIEPIISSMVIEYDPRQISRTIMLTYMKVFFQQTSFDPLDDLMVHVKPTVRRDLFRSIVTGGLLLVAFARPTHALRPDFLDYSATISAAWTVLSHGTNKLSHPDIIAGIVSMLSLGTANILHVAAITWGVNLLEIFFDMYRV